MPRPEDNATRETTEVGVDFPARSGRRSSTRSVTRILAEAVREHDADLARRIQTEPDWRHAYPRYLVEVTRLEATSATAALDIADRALRAAAAELVFTDASGDHQLTEIPRAARPLRTVAVTGTGAADPTLSVPYRGESLTGDRLKRQLADWVRRGIVEPSFGDAVGAVVDHPDWLDLSDRTFALVGAAAQMGPYAQLISWGARIAAVDRPGSDKWRRLVATARASAGTLLVPTSTDGQADPDDAGADLTSQPGEIVEWLRTIDGPLTLGNYGYAPGAAFVRLTVAFDVVWRELSRHRTDLSLAYLATPSDVFLVPRDAVETSLTAYHRLVPSMLAARAGHLLSGGRLLRPSYAAEDRAVSSEFGLVNAIIPDQGPNYVAAKRLQRWRMIMARAQGVTTSVHVAPPTRTRSVHVNPAMEERQRLTARLGLETFDADTSQALSAAILVHDLRNPAALAQPGNALAHPHEIFVTAANPGGRWRTPLEPASALPVLKVLERLRTGSQR